MLDEVRVIRVEPQPLAVVRRQASFAQLPSTVGEALEIVRAFLREHAIAMGQTVILYHDQLMNLEAGFEVMAALPPHEEVVYSSTPGGLVASVTYWGPYEGVSLAHTAIARQCVAGGLRLDGRNWEVYGEWSDDPEQLRTDVFYLLRDG